MERTVSEPMIKVSVIIPVYNQAPYLAECLDSVLAQTLREIEVICVDDGSTDGSERMLDDYAKRDLRVKVIHQSNAGVAAARNNGLAAATGEFIAFMDPDDKYPDDVVDAEYKKDTTAYDAVDLRVYSFEAETLTAKDGESEEALAKRQEAENKKALEKANKMLEGVTDEASFIKAAAPFIKEAEAGEAAVETEPVAEEETVVAEEPADEAAPAEDAKAEEAKDTENDADKEIDEISGETAALEETEEVNIYDDVNKRAYLEYPDGRIEYAKEA